MDYLSACAMAKDETSYLREWVEFHRLVGFERIYLYDNESKVPVRETLAPQIAEGFVKVTDWPGQSVQVSAYKHCLRESVEKTRWLAFFDLDEFLFPVVEWDLKNLLAHFEKYGGLVVNTLFFGSSDHLKRPEGLQIENYTIRTPGLYAWNRTVKTIAIPDRVTDIRNPHWCDYQAGTFSVNEDFARVDGPFADQSFFKVAINHYYLRSAVEYIRKLAKGSATGITKEAKMFDEINGMSFIYDPTILKYAPALKKRLAAL